MNANYNTEKARHGYLIQKENFRTDDLTELSPGERYKKRMERKKQIVSAAALGIVMCIIFALVKFIIGRASNSLAIESDAASSLTESYSSIVAVVGILLAHKKPTKEHPNGFGRIEFITGVVGAIFVIVAGWHYFETSLNRIYHPQMSHVSQAQVIVILITIAGKFILYLHDNKIGKKFQSSGLITASRNALLSCFSSFLVILSAVVAQESGIDIDGYVGLIISILMLWAGIVGVKNGMTPLLGSPVKSSVAKAITNILLEHDPIVGVYDLRVVNTGAGISRGTVNAEVPATTDAEVVYDAFRAARNEIYRKLGIDMVIGLISVNYCSDGVFPVFDEIAKEVMELDGVMNVHGFKWNQETGEVDLHVVVDFDHLNDEEMEGKIEEIVQEVCPNTSVLVDFNVNYLEEPLKDSFVSCSVEDHLGHPL